MIETYDWPRGSGKTTKAIEMLEKDESLYCVVPVYNMIELYPKHLRNRVISGSMDLSVNITSKRIKKVVLDEGFAYKKDALAKLYYQLGHRDIDVITYGTI